VIWRRLREAGVLGINARNIRYTLGVNARRFYPMVDDKLATKGLCEHAGIPVPKLYAVARHHVELRELPERLEAHQSFVVKPVRGAMGNGIAVVVGRHGGQYLRSDGRGMSREQFLYHSAGIISGLYSLAGHADAVMVEERLEVHPSFDRIATEGVPDVRVIVYRGFPVMAMTRLPTHASGGRANLHQGAIGVGIDLATGETRHAVLRGRPVRRNPDSGEGVLGHHVPSWARVLEIAVRATEETGLGYVGADVVVDGRLGPVILELNARPGLVIQLANRAGLRGRLDAVDALPPQDLGVDDRVSLARELFGEADAA
jgi:alpha-L-glutamate ligase-like protein